MKNKKILISIIIIIVVSIITFLITSYIKENGIKQENELNSGELEIIDNESDSLKLKILESDIVNMEISILDESSNEGIVYTNPIVISDKSKIRNILNVINSASFYPEEEFDKDYGVGGYFEGCPELTLYNLEGKKYTIYACDNFDENLNIFYISEVEDLSIKKLYKTNYMLSKKIKELYNEFNEVSEKSDFEIFLQYMAYLNQEKDVNFMGMTIEGIKLDISSYYVNSYIYDDSLGLLAYKKDDVSIAMKELFNDEIDLSKESAFGLKYNEDIDSFCYESGGDGYVSTYLIKIEEREYLGEGIYIATIIYAYPEESNFSDGTLPECDCYKTKIKYKENENYIYSKYQLVDEKTMESSYAGKVKDW